LKWGRIGAGIAKPSLLKAGLLIPGVLLAAAASQAFADMTVTGEAKYIDREHSFKGWTGNFPEKPIRHAVVDVLDADSGAILGTGTTGDDGAFSVGVMGSGTEDMIVRIYTLCTTMDPEEITVRADGLGGPLYSVSSAVKVGVDLDVDLDVGAVVADKLTISGQQGNPFDIFDAAVRVAEFIELHELRAIELPLGAVYPSPSGSTGAGGPSYIFVAASEGYDDSVVLHEFGHTVDNRYDWTPSGGGAHGFGQSNQNPVLAFSEGFASYFAGAVKELAGDPDPGYYMDAKGGGSTGSGSIALRMRYETRSPYTGTTGGEADEVAICAALWDLHDGPATLDPLAGDDDLADGGAVFIGGASGPELVIDGMNAMVPSLEGETHVIDLFGALFTEVGVQDYAAVRDAFELQKLRVSQDDWEPIFFGDKLPRLVPDAPWSEVLTLYSPEPGTRAPGIGDVDDYTFEAEAGRLYEVVTRYPGGIQDAQTYADTYLSVLNEAGEFIASDTNSGPGRNAKLQVVSATDATLTVRVQAETPARPTGSYQIRVRDQGIAVPPVITGYGEDPMATAIPTWIPGNQILGSGFTGVQSVTLDGQPIQFWETSDTVIDFLLPPLDKIGALEVAVTTPVATVTDTLTLVPPATSTLFATTSFGPFGIATIRIGTEPFASGVLLMSTSKTPSSLPGIADLAIGNGGTDLTPVAGFTTGASGLFALSHPYEQPAFTPLPVELQAIVLPVGSQGPWPVTNAVTLFVN